MPRKRTHDEMVTSDPAVSPAENDMLKKLRNMWEFASLFEWMTLFGEAAKLPQLDIEDFEAECTNPGNSRVLVDIGFKLINWISSRRDITLDNWDMNVRRHYILKSPRIRHPYGDNEEEPNHFRDFHIMTKIRVLHQMTIWTFWNPDRLRQHFSDVKEAEQFDYWQVHPIGWDKQDRSYYKFTGERLYRRTDPPVPTEPVKSKAKAKYSSKKAQAQRRRERSSKRRTVADSEDGDVDTEMDNVEETINTTEIGDETLATQADPEDDPETLNTFGDYKWECVAVTLEDYTAFIASITKSKDPNEKNLKAFIEGDILTALQAQEERRQRKSEAKLREVHLQEKMLGAKRSGRLAAKQEREQHEAEAERVEKERQALLAEARKEQDRQENMENDRRSRMMTREKRIKDREMKRVLLEEQLARDSEEEKRVEREGSRGSRHLKERIQQRKKELEEFEDDEWAFDCSGCHQHGKNWDDGQHSISCERCNVWQHSRCLGISKAAAERNDFHFICADCKRKEEEANRPKISLKFKVGNSSSPPQPKSISPEVQKQVAPIKQKLVSVDVPSVDGPDERRPSAPGVVVDGQFYPTFDPGRAVAAASSLPPAVGQPSMPQYAARHAPKSMPYMNGHPNAYNQYSAYPPQDRLPGTAHAQNLYNQVTYQQPPLAYSYHPANGHPQLPPQPTFHPGSIQSSQTPRPPSSHSQANGFSSPARQRIPSPIINKPTMSPTQGNPDVGPIAGVPGSSPSLQSASIATPYTNGHHRNGSATQTPDQHLFDRNPFFSASQSSVTQPVSGLSPTKQRVSPAPANQPNLIPQKQRAYQTPSSSFQNAQHSFSRSVSGTPIFPPAEKLAPSPQQLNREPVPTPSKQSPPPQRIPAQLQGFGSNGTTAVQYSPQEPQQENQERQQQQQPHPQPGTVQ